MRLNRNRWAIMLALTCCASFTIVSCGGSGGPSGPPVVPASTMRANLPGDSWLYNVTTTLPFIGNGSGTYALALTNDTYDGDPSVRSTETFSLTYPNGPLDLSAYSELGPKGNLLAVIDGGPLTPVKSDTFSLTGVFSSSTHSTGVLTLGDGTVQTIDYRVVGTQEVTVPAGTFACWVVNETATTNTGTRDSFTYYVDPTLGNWVKADVQTLYGDGQEFDWHAQLKSLVTVAASKQTRASASSAILTRFHPKVAL